MNFQKRLSSGIIILEHAIVITIDTLVTNWPSRGPSFYNQFHVRMIKAVHQKYDREKELSLLLLIRRVSSQYFQT